MLCCVCHQNEATVHLTQIANDKIQKVDLCEPCAKAKGVNDPTGFSLADLLLGLGSAQELTPGAEKGEEVACPRCGFTQADFKKTGRLGCADCYATFKDGLSGMLKSMHKGVRHVGKTPGEPAPRSAGKPEAARPPAPKADASQRVKTLETKLRQAVASEDYEQAARLRDEIRELKSDSQPAGA